MCNIETAAKRYLETGDWRELRRAVAGSRNREVSWMYYSNPGPGGKEKDLGLVALKILKAAKDYGYRFPPLHHARVSWNGRWPKTRVSEAVEREWGVICEEAVKVLANQAKGSNELLRSSTSQLCCAPPNREDQGRLSHGPPGGEPMGDEPSGN